MYARLTRVTSSGSFIPQIDGLRFVAIAIVVLHHISNYVFLKVYHEDRSIPTASYLIEGRWGVPLFFVISGFIVALPFARSILQGARPVRLRDYFTRRVSRLEPPYIISLLILFPLVLAVQHSTARSQIAHLIASMLYIHNLAYGSLSTINPVTWSLEAEIQFYLIAPLLAQVYRFAPFLRRSLLLLAMLTAAFLQSDQPGGIIEASFFGYAQYFLGGLLLADFYICKLSTLPKKSLYWDFVSLAGWTVMCLVVIKHWEPRYLFVFLAMLVYAAAFVGRISSWFFSRPIFTVIGGMCYTIYLYHSAVISAVGRHLLQYHYSTYGRVLLLHTLVEVPPIMLISVLMFVLVERPCMERGWPTRLMRRLAIPIDQQSF